MKLTYSSTLIFNFFLFSLKKIFFGFCFLIPLLFNVALKAQNSGNFQCGCQTSDISEMYCLFKDAGYILISGVTITSKINYTSDCPCDENLPAFTSSGSNTRSPANNELFVTVNGVGADVRTYFDELGNYINGSTNFEIYDIADVCQNLNSILQAPQNSSNYNASIVLLDDKENNCDYVFVKEIVNDPCGLGFTYMNRNDFPAPSYQQGSLKPGDFIYYDYINNTFKISSLSPGPYFNKLDNTSLVFEINSYIDTDYDGPSAPFTICGEKLISYIGIIPNYDVSSNTYSYNLTSNVKVGATGGIPALTGRSYFENLPNMSLDHQNVTSFNGCFEQHASVPFFEELGLYILGYDIVNVAQKADIDISQNTITVKFLTDIFPSASFTLLGEGDFFGQNQTSRILDVYQQPSFKNTHCYIPTQIECNSITGRCIIAWESKRPDPSFYCRFLD